MNKLKGMKPEALVSVDKEVRSKYDYFNNDGVGVEGC